MAGLLIPCLHFSAAGVATVPEGFVTLTVAAGTGTSKKITAISIPLYDVATANGQMAGKISSVTANSITNLSAGWTAGQLSAVSAPYLIKITSGSAIGRTFLISTAAANTGTSVTIDSKDAAQVDLTTLGILNGDTYEIYACDTMLSLFGTPETTGILGGTSPNNADSLMISINGALETYFYSTTNNRWTKGILGSPDATNTPIRPDTGILYSRLGSTDLTITLLGRVSATDRVAAIKNSGSTILAHNWPVSSTLANSKINLIPTWTANVSPSAADKVKIITNGSIVTYWFDGTNWRKQILGSPISNNEVIQSGSAVLLEQIGSDAGYTSISQPLPYILN